MTPVSLEAVQSGLIDVLMFSLNPAFDRMPGYLPGLGLLLKAARPDRETEAANSPDARKALYHACRSRGVGIVVMKAYGAGYLLNPAQSHPLTPVHCLQYALDQPGVATVVPGMKNAEELGAALRLLSASPEEKDYSAVLAGSQWNLQGECMYCNHCLPCPAGIDVAEALRLIDAARQEITPALRLAYQQLAADASACLACGDCMDRCPFQVDVAAKMREGVAAFSR
ncbi:MAG: oxidoreductase of the aldo/keto reductase [Armatimonadota bacterium]